MTLGLAALAAAACSPTEDAASRPDLPEAPLAAGVSRAPWRDPNTAPADEIMVGLVWDPTTRRLSRVVPGAPVYTRAYFDDDEVRRICEDKVRAAHVAGRPVVSVYARRGVRLGQAVHVANDLAKSKTFDVRLYVEE